MERRFPGAVICLFFILSSCVSTPDTVAWRPKGGPSTRLNLESENKTGLFAAIVRVNGEELDPYWYLFEPGGGGLQSPEVLGRGRPADRILLDAGPYDFELMLYESGGLPGRRAWRDERLPVRIKALRPGQRYALVLSENLPLRGRAEDAVASLSLYEQGVREKLVQRWFITGMPEKGKEDKLLFVVKTYGIVEDEELSFF